MAAYSQSPKFGKTPRKKKMAQGATKPVVFPKENEDARMISRGRVRENGADGRVGAVGGGE